MALPLSKLSKRPLTWSDSDSETTNSPAAAAAKRQHRAVRPAIRFDDEVYVAKPFARRRSQTSGGDSLACTPSFLGKRSSHQSVDGVELARSGSISSCQTLDLFADDALCFHSDRGCAHLRRESTGATVPCATAETFDFGHRLDGVEGCELRTKRRVSSAAPDATRCRPRARDGRNQPAVVVSTLEKRTGWDELDANVVAACNLLWMSFQPPMCANFCGARHVQVPSTAVKTSD